MPVLPVSIARENLSKVLEDCKVDPVYLEKHGRQIAVLLSIERFNELNDFYVENRDAASAYEILLDKYVKLQSK